MCETEGEPVGLLDVWEGVDTAIVVDAVSSGSPAGTIHRFDASSAALPASIAGARSTHAVGLGQAIELARALGRLPNKLIVYGIEGERFSAGEELSPSVAGVLEAVADRIHHEAQEPEEGRPQAFADDA